jgi:hypothetical protein
MNHKGWVESQVSGLKVYFRPEDRQDAHAIEQYCLASFAVLEQLWGLKAPLNCRIFVMTDWRSFIFDSATTIQRIRYYLAYPLWVRRIGSMWQYVGGWTLPYRKAPVVGIKPGRLASTSDRTIGRQIFIEQPDPQKKICNITAHELTHAAAAHLSLPAWLNEGLAMRTADAVLGVETVMPETLELIKKTRRGARIWFLMNLNWNPRSSQDLVYRYVRGYWITRYFQQTNPNVLKSILRQRLSRQEIYLRLGKAAGLKGGNFWTQIDRRVYEFFTQSEGVRN